MAPFFKIKTLGSTFSVYNIAALFSHFVNFEISEVSFHRGYEVPGHNLLENTGYPSQHTIYVLLIARASKRIQYILIGIQAFSVSDWYFWYKCPGFKFYEVIWMGRQLIFSRGLWVFITILDRTFFGQHCANLKCFCPETYFFVSTVEKLQILKFLYLHPGSAFLQFLRIWWVAVQASSPSKRAALHRKM